MTRNELANELEFIANEAFWWDEKETLHEAAAALRDVGVTDARVALIKRLVQAEQNLRIAYDGDMPFIHGCVELNEAVELVALEAALSPKAAPSGDEG